MNATLNSATMKTTDRLLAEAMLIGCLRTIYADGGLKAVQSAAARALQEIAREKRDELEGWVV